MDKFDPSDPKWAKMNKIQLYCKKAPSFILFCIIKSLSVPQDATGGKSHANLIEVPTVAGSAAVAAPPLEPEVATLDASGRVVSTPKVKVKQQAPVEIIHFQGWLNALDREKEAVGVKAAVKKAMLQADAQFNRAC